jgi:hypothetical protein
MFVMFFQSIFILTVKILNAFWGLIAGSECFIFEIALMGRYAVLIGS